MQANTRPKLLMRASKRRILQKVILMADAADTELSELRRRRLEQLKQLYEEQQRSQLEKAEEEQQLLEQFRALEEIAKGFMSKEALQRYSTVKLAHPETAAQLAVAIAQAVQTGKLRGMITDEQLKQALAALSKQKK